MQGTKIRLHFFFGLQNEEKLAALQVYASLNRVFFSVLWIVCVITSSGISSSSDERRSGVKTDSSMAYYLGSKTTL